MVLPASVRIHLERRIQVQALLRKGVHGDRFTGRQNFELTIWLLHDLARVGRIAEVMKHLAVLEVASV